MKLSVIFAEGPGVDEIKKEHRVSIEDQRRALYAHSPSSRSSGHKSLPRQLALQAGEATDSNKRADEKNGKKPRTKPIYDLKSTT